MNRREILGALGATAAGLAITGPEAFGQEPGRRGGGGRDEMAQRAAKACSDCMNACNEGFHHCYEQLAAGKKEYADAAHLCVDCAEMCACCAQICGRVSPLKGICCEACAKCCDECIAACEKLNDPRMKGTIDACRRCATECRQLAGAAGSGRNSAEAPGSTTEQVIYTCPMHPEVQQPKPGKCPKCGMDLVPKK